MKLQTFKQNPMHHFTMNLPGHPASSRFDFNGVRVKTDFPLARQNSKAYREDLQRHIQQVEADAAKPAKPKTIFVESARGKRRR